MTGYTVQEFDSAGNSYPDNDTFATNELVYDTSTTTFYEITGVSGGGPYSYTFTTLTGATTVTEALEAGTDDIAAHSTFQLDTYDLSDLQVIQYKALKKYETSKDSEDWKTYLSFNAMMVLITYEFENGNYTTAQKLVENLDDYENCLSDVVCNLPVI